MKTKRMHALLCCLLEAELLLADPTHTEVIHRGPPADVSGPTTVQYLRDLNDAVAKNFVSANNIIAASDLEGLKNPGGKIHIWNVSGGKSDVAGSQPIGPMMQTDNRPEGRGREVLDLSPLRRVEATAAASPDKDMIVLDSNCPVTETCQSLLTAVQILSNQGYKNIKVLKK